MPRITRQELPSVAPTAQPTPLLGESTVESATRTTSTIARATSDLATFAVAQGRRASATARTKADNDLRDLMRELEYGEQGFRSHKGESALEGDRIAQQEFEKGRDQIANGLRPQDRSRWLAESGRSSDGFRRRVMEYTLAEQDKAAQLEWQADLQGSTQSALDALADFPDDEERQRAAIREFGDVVAERLEVSNARAEEMGWPEKFKTAQLEEWKSKTIRSAVENLVAQDRAIVADELFSELRGDMLQSDESAVAVTMGPAKDREVAIGMVAGLFEGVNDLNFNADDRARIDARINDEKNAKRQEVMRIKADERYRQLTATKLQRDEDETMRLWKEIEQHRDVTKLPTDEYFSEHLHQSNREMLEKRAKLLSEDKDFADVTDWARVQSEWTFEVQRDEEGNITSQKPRSNQYQVDYNLLKLQPYMKEADWKALRREQEAAIGSAGAAAGKGPSMYGGAHARLKELLNQAGDEAIALLNEDPATIARLEGKVREKIEDMRADPSRNGRPISGPERDAMLSEVLSGEFTDDGFRFDTVSETHFANTTFPVFMARLLDIDDEEHMQFDGDVPAQEERLVRDALRRRFGGREPSTDEVRTAYGQHIIGNDEEISAFMDAAKAGEERTVESQIDPSIRDEVARLVALSGSDPDDPQQLLAAWKEMRAMFQQSAHALAIGSPSLGVGLNDQRKGQAMVAARLYATLRQSGKTDIEAREMLNLIVPFAVGIRQPGPPPAEGSDAAK